MLISELLPLGFDANRIRSELQFLVSSMCIFTEHQRTEALTDEDLICLSHAGFAHLSMVGNFDYLAACSEDTWNEDFKLAEAIAERIGQHGIWFHYARETTRNNALEFVDYLLTQSKKIVSKPTQYLEIPGDDTAGEIENIQWKVAKGVEREREKEKWPDVDGKFEVGKSYAGTVNGSSAFGVFVDLDDGPTGMVHVSKWPRRIPISSVVRGDKLLVRLLAIDRMRKRLSLAYDRKL
jgi:transcriptional accessory protein Tex/SPT6